MKLIDYSRNLIDYIKNKYNIKFEILNASQKNSETNNNYYLGPIRQWRNYGGCKGGQVSPSDFTFGQNCYFVPL